MEESNLKRYLLNNGQSPWLDYLSRPLIDRNRLEKFIGLGIKGVTSNPSIFDKAISKTSDYDGIISDLSKKGLDTFSIYDEITTRDVRDAADILRPVYEDTGWEDGYVSIEVDPGLALDKDGTIKEAERLFNKIQRPNIMVKIPATEPGVQAGQRLLSEGMNINFTLIFSVEQYRDVCRAYIRGADRCSGKNGDDKGGRSVASVFVSRLDTAVDKKIESMGLPNDMAGRAAVAHTRIIYSVFKEMFDSDEFRALREKGVPVQRPLWASTGTKNPEYSDIKYVKDLVGRDTVNTLPEKTINNFLDHGEINQLLKSGAGGAEETVRKFNDAGLDIEKICRELLDGGLKAFEESFDSLLKSIELKS